MICKECGSNMEGNICSRCGYDSTKYETNNPDITGIELEYKRTINTPGILAVIIILPVLFYFLSNPLHEFVMSIKYTSEAVIALKRYFYVIYVLVLIPLFAVFTWAYIEFEKKRENKEIYTFMENAMRYTATVLEVNTIDSDGYKYRLLLRIKTDDGARNIEYKIKETRITFEPGNYVTLYMNEEKLFIRELLNN